MEFSTTSRALIGAVLGLIVCAIIYAFTPTVIYSPHGIYLPLADSMAPVASDKVTLYPPQSAPLLAKTLGTVSVEMHADQLDLNTQQQVVRFAQDLAAQNGGNGIVPDKFFLGNSGLTSTVLFQGKVIHN